MPFPKPEEYGYSLGGYRDEAPLALLSLKLRQGGLNFSTAASDLEDGETPYCLDVQLDKLGVEPDWDITEFDAAAGGAADKSVVHIAPFELDTGTKFMMRLRPTRWDRWNGLNWLQLGGVLSGADADLLYSLQYGNAFIGANGIDRLKYWDGVDANNVQDLSADSPKAFYICKIGTRILAARIKIGATIFPFNLQWCADGDITDWTTAADGAGGVTLYPEGSNKAANIITGLSSLEGSAVIYRQRSIVLATQTGLGDAPFQFSTVDFGHGTYSPYSIASGGMKSGDYFLGDDYMPYFFDGRERPEPIGENIFDVIRTSVYDPAYVQGVVDSRSQRYWLGIPTDSTHLVKLAYVFSIREWVRTGRKIWWKYDLTTGYRSVAAGNSPTTTDPIVDTVTDIVDTVGRRVDDFANTQGDDRMLFGDDNGQVWYQDLSTPLMSGVWRSKTIGDGHTEVTLGRVRLVARCASSGAVEVSVSTDGGLNFTSAKIYTFSVTGSGVQYLSDYFGIDGSHFQIQLRFISGMINVSEIAYVLDGHGRTND